MNPRTKFGIMSSGVVRKWHQILEECKFPKSDWLWIAEKLDKQWVKNSDDFATRVLNPFREQYAKDRESARDGVVELIEAIPLEESPRFGMAARTLDL